MKPNLQVLCDARGISSARQPRVARGSCTEQRTSQNISILPGGSVGWRRPWKIRPGCDSFVALRGAGLEPWAGAVAGLC